MVGIVIVSHSFKVGEGIVDFCRELKNCDFRMISASGLDRDILGTNPLLIKNAIEETDTGDGVLILCDLGSSVMSSQMAVELLSTPHNVIIADAPIVEGAIIASSVNSIKVSLDELYKEVLESKNFSKL